MQKIAQKVYCVVGPTAVGKTAYALTLARELLEKSAVTGVDLISADSRQVYRGLEIISGADIPPGFQKDADGSFFNGSIRLHGVSILDVSQEWSVAHFVMFARTIIAEGREKSRAIIVVGGTGLYQQKLFDSGETLFIPQNTVLRSDLAGLSIIELQKKAFRANPEKFEKLNNSDLHNQRRLVRLIEVAEYVEKHDHSKESEAEAIFFEQVLLGLTASLPILEKRIQERVSQRFYAGAISEVVALLANENLVSATALSCLGVSDISSHLKGEISGEECLRLWALHEFQYAKRQLTWWKKTPNIEWVVSS